MSKQDEPVNLVHLLKERSVWKDVKGRTLICFQRWHQGSGADLRCVDVELLIVGAVKMVKRPYKEVESLILDGKMKYVGECTTI